MYNLICNTCTRESKKAVYVEYHHTDTSGEYDQRYMICPKCGTVKREVGFTQDSLGYRVSNEIPLSEDEKSLIYQFLTHGRRESTREKLYKTIFEYGVIRLYGMYNRLLLDENEVKYCAGQDMGAEMNTLVNLLANKNWG